MSINVDRLVENRVSYKYPNIVIDEANNTVPVIRTCLKEGDVQLIVIYKDKCKVLANISLSAFNIDKLIRTCGSLTFNINDTKSITINSVEDYLEYFA